MSHPIRSEVVITLHTREVEIYDDDRREIEQEAQRLGITFDKMLKKILSRGGNHPKEISA